MLHQTSGGEDYYHMPLAVDVWMTNALTARIDQVPTNWFLETKMRNSSTNNYYGIGFGIYDPVPQGVDQEHNHYYKLHAKHNSGNSNGQRFIDDSTQSGAFSTFTAAGPSGSQLVSGTSVGQSPNNGFDQWFATRIEQVTSDFVFNGTTITASTAAPTYIIKTSWAGDLNALEIDKIYTASGAYNARYVESSPGANDWSYQTVFYSNTSTTSADTFSGYNPNAFKQGQVITAAYNKLNNVQVGQDIAFNTEWTATQAPNSSYDVAFLRTNLLATIPEPSTMALMGIASLGMMRLRRKK
jgi:PEP-CTERM motif